MVTICNFLARCAKNSANKYQDYTMYSHCMQVNTLTRKKKYSQNIVRIQKKNHLR